MIDWAAIDSAIAKAQGAPFAGERRTRLGGGSINTAYRIEAGERSYFVKLNRAERETMFAAEAAGLAELGQAVGLRVPRVIAQGRAGAHAYLVLEHIALHALSPAAMTRLGEALADMHGIVAARYGFERDNTIGTSDSKNGRSGSVTSTRALGTRGTPHRTSTRGRRGCHKRATFKKEIPFH